MNWNDVKTNWKSTVTNLLTVTLVTTVGLLSYPPVLAHPKWVAILGGVQVVAKLWIGLITKDAKQ